MKFTSTAFLALIATAAAQNPGRDRLTGETCAADDNDRCVNNKTDKKEEPNLKCCHLRLSVASVSRDTLCVNTDEKVVTIADGTGISYSYDCDYKPITYIDGAYNMGVSAVVATLSALYLAA